MLDLAGTWQLREAIGETWRWYTAARPPAALNNVEVDVTPVGWLSARVPGSVVDALFEADAIPDPRRGFGSRSAEWTGRRSWVLRRFVELDASWIGADVVLEFDGLDPGGRVFWDGAEVARAEGPYRAARLPVVVDRPGRHELAVVLDPVPPTVPQVGRTEEVVRHAPRVNAGWDFCPPFPHQGIWRPARLRRAPRLARVEVVARCDAAGMTGHLEVVVEVDADAGDPAEVTVVLDARDGRAVLEQRAPVVDGLARALLAVEHPPLWQVAGVGEPHLVDVVVRFGDQVERLRTGFRSVEAVRTPGSPTGAEAYGLRVNGADVALPGVNWAPADAQFGSVTVERLEHLLDVAVAAGARLLRVWGGGLVETPEFYAACDARGLLVWQEFSQSSSGLQSAPGSDPAFLAALEADARELVAARRHHPSLVIWGGGNELEGENGPLRTEHSPALSLLAGVVRELDPDRHWLPTSPSGPAFHHRLDVIRSAPDDQHDVHGPWEYQGLEAQHDLADAGTALAHTEFGVEGMANRRLWDHVVPEGRGEPADRSNPLHRHLGEWWNNAPQVRELFGGDLDLENLRRASQWLQTSGLATALEADRRRWPRTSMVLPWQLAESYPNTWGTALVGFDGEPKPALGAVARAFASERATLRTARTAWGGHTQVTAEAWLWSGRGRPAGGTLELAVLDLAGRTLAREWVLLDSIEHPVAVAGLTAPTPDGVFIWRARWRDGDGRVIDDELLVQTGGFDLAALLSLPGTTLDVAADRDGWRIHNSGEVAAIAWGAHDVRPGDDRRLVAALGDPRPILPGAERHLALVSGEVRGGDLVVDAWNADSVPLPPIRKEPA
jgi:beta-mannosidase